MTSYLIDRYMVNLYSSRPNSAGSNDPIADIQLFSGPPPESVLRGTAIFLADGSPLPGLGVNTESIAVYYHISMLAVVLSILRGEGPISVFQIDGMAGLTTAEAEPIGEQEGGDG